MRPDCDICGEQKTLCCSHLDVLKRDIDKLVNMPGLRAHTLRSALVDLLKAVERGEPKTFEGKPADPRKDPADE